MEGFGHINKVYLDLGPKSEVHLSKAGNDTDIVAFITEKVLIKQEKVKISMYIIIIIFLKSFQ